MVQGHHVRVSPILERMGSRRERGAVEFPRFEIYRCWEETEELPRRRRVPTGRDGAPLVCHIPPRPRDGEAVG